MRRPALIKNGARLSVKPASVCMIGLNLQMKIATLISRSAEFILCKVHDLGNKSRCPTANRNRHHSQRKEDSAGTPAKSSGLDYLAQAAICPSNPGCNPSVPEFFDWHRASLCW